MSFYKISVILQLCYLILISDTALFQNTAQKTEVGLYMLYYLQIENFCSVIKCRRSTKYQMLQKKISSPVAKTLAYEKSSRVTEL